MECLWLNLLKEVNDFNYRICVLLHMVSTAHSKLKMNHYLFFKVILFLSKALIDTWILYIFTGYYICGYQWVGTKVNLPTTEFCLQTHTHKTDFATEISTRHVEPFTKTISKPVAVKTRKREKGLFSEKGPCFQHAIFVLGKYKLFCKYKLL